MLRWTSGRDGPKRSKSASQSISFAGYLDRHAIFGSIPFNNIFRVSHWVVEHVKMIGKKILYRGHHLPAFIIRRAIH
jgi:hypothetical protein